MLGASEGVLVGRRDDPMLGKEEGACDGEREGCKELYAAALDGKSVG